MSMKRAEKVGELLKKYRYNKARLVFLENQLKRLVPESHEDYIESRAFKPGDSGNAPLFVMEGGEEIAALNKIEETAYEYRDRCRSNYRSARLETRNEMLRLSYSVSIVEDGLEILDRVNGKYKTVIEKYYIGGGRMEDIADELHMSRSRCYDLCKEAVRWLARVVYGENTAV